MNALILILLMIWAVFVAEWLSKKVATRLGIYIARKTIHILGGGVVLMIYALFFKTGFELAIIATLLTIYTFLRHLYKRADHFQIKENYGDIYFCFSYATLLYLIDFKIAIPAILFMALGDGITGIIRNFSVKKRQKDIWGSIGMLAISIPVGWFYLGWVGIIGAVVATFLEAPEYFLTLGKRTKPLVDDNILIPFGSAIIMSLLKGGLI